MNTTDVSTGFMANCIFTWQKENALNGMLTATKTVITRGLEQITGKPDGGHRDNQAFGCTYHSISLR